MGAWQRLLAICTAIASLACALPALARASATQQSILMDDDHLIYAPPKAMAHTLSDLAALGVDRVKVSVVWWLVAPSPNARHRPKFDATNPAVYPAGRWARYDMIVRMAQQLGLKVYFQITPPIPAWAINRHLPRGQGSSLGQAPNAADFGRFVQAVGERYSGSYVASPPANEPCPTIFGVPIPGCKTTSNQPTPIPHVDYWGLWNEPNFPSWLNPWHRAVRGRQQMTQPLIYRGMVNAAWHGLAATGHSGDTILIGETANFGNLYPLPFVEDLYCVNSHYAPLTGGAAAAVGCPSSGNRARFIANNPGLFGIAGFAHHPYSFDHPPGQPYPASNWVTMFNLGSLEGVLNGIFASYGRRPAGGVPLYLTEWGYKTNPPNPYVKTSLGEQAAWLDEGEYMTWRDPYVHALAQFLLYDDKPVQGQPVGSSAYWRTFQTGLLFQNGKAKPSFYAFRIPIWLPNPRHGASVTVWGQLRPANHAGVQRAMLLFQPRGSRSWGNLHTLQTTSSEGFVLAQVSIPGAGTVRIAWTAPNGTVYRSRAVAVS